MSKCRSCGAPIMWVKTISGKKHPLDESPTDDGVWTVEFWPDGTAVMLQIVEGTRHVYSGPRYTSHFATCPHADQHRKATR